MKKLVVLLVLLCFTYLTLTACEGDDNNTTEPSQRSSRAEADANVDLDISVLSGTMAHGAAERVFLNPGEYLGKSIKVKGEYEYWEVGGKSYHFVIVGADSGQCVKYFEFESDGELPAVGETVVVMGVFEAYDEDGDTFYRLSVS